ncbi:hypothetical protein [Neobacillus ginsengisoli]|uniref:Uncharacterized protein n=1 Tax=Neobacillus ginsengisoli TaxID=904295 RepID=A0ABT9Y2X5_9BACI|nr:hypothetical protein [Neobacillus ginsengisoli]MDQ0202175.1 hypothetical protein [Neobacillus ginsengisoli]
MTLTTEEFVMKFGTKVQKAKFKRDGKLGSRTRESIIKTAEQEYIVEIVKLGRSNIYVCTKRVEKVMKKDGRVRSGREQVEHRIPMDIIVAVHLEYDMTKQASMSLGKWAVEFGLISELESDLLLSRHSSTLRQKHIDLAIENGLLEEDQTKLLDEFTLHCLEIYGQLVKTLEHMKKCGIILFYENWMGYGKDGKVNINPEIMKKIQKTRRDLMKKHDVVEFNLTAHRNAKKVKNFKLEWKQALAEVKDEFGNVLGIKYYWKEYAVILKATSKVVQRYLETYCAEELEAYVNNKDLFINQNEANYVLKRKANFMKKAEKRHKQKLKEYKEMKVGFATAEDEELIRYFYTQKELEDIITGYDLGVKRLHLQNLYMERMGQLFDLYKLKSIANNTL